jgi:hypothetical protein
MKDKRYTNEIELNVQHSKFLAATFNDIRCMLFFKISNKVDLQI